MQNNSQKRTNIPDLKLVEKENSIKTKVDAEIKLDVALNLLKEGLMTKELSTKDICAKIAVKNLQDLQKYLGYISYTNDEPWASIEAPF